MTLKEIGLIDALKNQGYDYWDRADIKDPADYPAFFRKSLTADVYLSSSNAITENGELYNVDGNSNRVAAMLYGPKSVIVVAGINKIVKDLDEAALRVKTVAAPLNTKRLSKETYCAEKGICVKIVGVKGGRFFLCIHIGVFKVNAHQLHRLGSRRSRFRC